MKAVSATKLRILARFVVTAKKSEDRLSGSLQLVRPTNHGLLAAIYKAAILWRRRTVEHDFPFDRANQMFPKWNGNATATLTSNFEFPFTITYSKALLSHGEELSQFNSRNSSLPIMLTWGSGYARQLCGQVSYCSERQDMVVATVHQPHRHCSVQAW